MLDLDLSLIPVDIILIFINIILLFVIVKMLVFKPVKKFLENRAQKTADTMKNAEEVQKSAEALKAEYDNLLKNSRDEVKNIIKDGEIKAAEKSEAIIENANRQAEEILAEARKKIEEERREAQEEIKKEIVVTAIKISEKILEREINDADVRKVAENYFSNPGGKIV